MMTAALHAGSGLDLAIIHHRHIIAKPKTPFAHLHVNNGLMLRTTDFPPAIALWPSYSRSRRRAVYILKLILFFPGESRKKVQTIVESCHGLGGEYRDSQLEINSNSNST